MSVFLMCDASEPGAVLNEYWTKNSGANPPRPIYIKEYYAGCVVSLREMNGYDDSDFYATVYDAAEDKFKEVCYASTRGWTYPNNAVIDASAEVMEKYAAHLAYLAEGYKALKAEMDGKKVSVGDKIKVVGGRKVPLGTIGYVASIADNPYDPKNPKVAIQANNCLMYTYMKNLLKIKDEA